MSYFKNLIIDILATRILGGDLINWLPQSIRIKARENLDSRTVVVQRLSSGLSVYKTLNAKEWSKRA